MAVPRKKISRVRRNTRRAHHAISGTTGSVCPKCLEPKLHHHACSSCGTYKGREVLTKTVESAS